MADPQERSTPGLMADLLDQVTQLVRKEVQLFRAEMSDKATQAMVAAGSILAAAVVAITRAERLGRSSRCRPGQRWHSRGLVGGDRRGWPGDRRVPDGEEGHRQPQGREPGTGADNPRRGSGRLDGEGENLMAEFSTNPGDRSVTELEREVDRERERVSATIDELQARASVGSLVDQLVKAVGENGGEVSRNLGRSLRDNPLAALLTGVGLAWLMAGSGRPRDEGRDWEDPDRDDLPYAARSSSRGVDAQRVNVRKQRRGLVAEIRVSGSRCRTRGGRPARARCRHCRPGWRGGVRKLSKVCASAPQTSRIRRAPGCIRPAIRSARPAALSAIGPEPHVGALPGRAVTCAMASTP